MAEKAPRVTGLVDPRKTLARVMGSLQCYLAFGRLLVLLGLLDRFVSTSR